jgi:hypothetical protein
MLGTVRYAKLQRIYLENMCIPTWSTPFQSLLINIMLYIAKLPILNGDGLCIYILYVLLVVILI